MTPRHWLFLILSYALAAAVFYVYPRWVYGDFSTFRQIVWRRRGTLFRILRETERESGVRLSATTIDRMLAAAHVYDALTWPESIYLAAARPVRARLRLRRIRRKSSKAKSP